MRKNRIYSICRLALLSALAIALSTLESIFTPALPPGAKAGLSNVVVMFAASFLGLLPTLLIVAFKAVFALLIRGVISFVLSLAGGLASALLLWILFRFARGLGVFGISILGALCHSLSQLLVSCLLYGDAVLAYAPILILLAIPGGLITAAALCVSESLISRTKNRKRKGNRL